MVANWKKVVNLLAMDGRISRGREARRTRMRPRTMITSRRMTRKVSHSGRNCRTDRVMKEAVIRSLSAAGSR